jgi:hypothetical protein
VGVLHTEASHRWTKAKNRRLCHGHAHGPTVCRAASGIAYTILRATQFFESIGAPINDQSLTPGANPIVGATRFEQWLKSTSSPY